MAHPFIPCQDEINDLVWRASETFRAGQPPGSHLNHVLVLLCLKFLSDFAKEPNVIPRQSPVRWRLPDGVDFDRLYHSETGALGERIDCVLRKIGPVNRSHGDAAFPSVSFSDDETLGEIKEREFRLRRLLKDFLDPRLDFRPSRIGALDVIGNCHDHLVTRSASTWGDAGRSFLSPEVSGQVLKFAAAHRMKMADLPLLQRRIDELECELAMLRLEMRKQLKELKR
jgi:type I restriction enzyme M protein